MGKRHTYRVKPDDTLLEFANAGEKEAYLAFCEAGSYDEAAKALKQSYEGTRSKIRRLKAKAARKGYMPEHGSKIPLPDSMRARGLTVQADANGEVIQYWLKGWQEHGDKVMAWCQALERAGESLRKLKLPKVPSPRQKLSKDMLAMYLVGDPHFGMHAWHREAGGDWDLKIAKKSHLKAFELLASTAPPAEEGLIMFAGDNAHVDDSKSRTPTHGHPLDTDNRWSKILDDLIETLVQGVRMLLTKHKRLRVIVLAGNHDPQTSTALRMILRFIFANDPRVTVDDDRHTFTRYRFGDCFFGFHHGHGCKIADLPLLCSLKWSKDWDATWRRIYTGHLHKEATMNVGSVPVDILQTLACTDVYADSHGYLASRAMICDTWHKTEGFQSRQWAYIRHINQALAKDKKNG